MKDIIALLLDNFTTICLALGLGIIVVTNKYLDERTNRPFMLVIVLVLVLMIADVVDYYFTYFPELNHLRFFASATGYTLRPASLAVFLNILLRRKKVGIALWIPIILVGILAFTSDFTHAMFWFTPQNRFMRGPLSFISHYVSGVYLVALITLTIKMHRQITASEVFAVLYVAVICVVATVLETVLSNYKFLLTGAMMTACAVYYLVLYIETYKRDPLTGLMNRRSFYMDTKNMRNKSIAVISADLNGLKDLNDLLGHSAGDKALQKMGSAMMVKSGKDFSAYRVGGDEFIALGKEQTEEAVQRYIDDMRAALKADGLMASFGVAYYNSNDNFDDICNRADTRMYDDKKKYKHRTAGRSE